MTMPPATQPAAIINMALRSFGQARTALRTGRVDDMINQLTRGAELLELIGQSADADGAEQQERRSAARRRPARSATS